MGIWTVSTGLMLAFAEVMTEFFGFQDIYLEIKITVGTGTYLYIYNPYIVFD